MIVSKLLTLYINLLKIGINKGDFVMDIDKLIENSRKIMEEIITLKDGNLLDPAVIKASQNLDILINKYNEINNFE